MRTRLPLFFLALAFLFAVNACGDDGGGSGGLSGSTYPEIEVSPAALSFSALAANQTQTLTVTIANTGSGDALNIKDVYIRDEGMPFSVGELVQESVLVNESMQVSVTYTSQGENPPVSALMIQTNASNTPLVEVPITVSESTTGLLVFPDPIDFGDVLGGESKTKQVTIENWESTTTTIVNTFVQVGSSPDFVQVMTPEYPATIIPGEKIIVDLSYTPTGGDADTGQFIVAYNENGKQQLLQIDIKGREVGPELNVAPAMLDFGWVAVDDSKTLALTVYNMGEHDLKLTGMSVAPGSNADIALVTPFTGTVTIPGGQNQAFDVTFAPTEFFATTADPIGGIVLESNDNDETTVTIPVYGNIDAPFIRVTPSDQVDFGIVAQNWTITREVTIENIGHAPLDINLLEISQNSADLEFAIPEDQEFTGTATILAEESIVVEVTFSNLGAPTGEEVGAMHIASTDPITPDLYLDLVAQRGGQPECKIGFIPPKLEFGTVAHGSEATQTIFVKNSGSGYCSWKSGIIRECTSWMGLMTQCAEGAGPSGLFTPLGMPIPIKDGMAPGTSHPIQVRYKPPTSIPWIPVMEEYHGVLQVNYTEPYSTPGENDYAEHTLPQADSMGTLPWNVHGRSGVADIAVLPDRMEFGLVTIGCYSQTITVKAYNAGTAPLDITDIYLEGCGPEFQLKSMPELPISVGASQFEELSAVYLPQNEGVDECYMVIESSDMGDPIVKVPLIGEGTWETENTDYFTQLSGKKVDILFVVDESASMCDEQSNLASNMQAFTSHAYNWDNDFQIGIVTTNIDEDYDMVGRFQGSPRIITNTTVASLPGNVEDIGCGGSGTQESGLEAGRRALTPPNITNTEKPCTCGADQPCPGSCLEGELCVGGFCGGWNRGFMREDASLELVLMSDEEDQSPGSVPFYIDYFMSIKGFLNSNLFHAHAICGDKNGGCNNPNGNDGADAGNRYIDVQEATGGKFGSICDASFSTVLSDIGEIAFGLQIQFFLSAQADSSPGSIRVWLDRGNGFEECTSGWEYHQPTNSIAFDENGTCMPIAGDEIKVWYKMVCFTE